MEYEAAARLIDEVITGRSSESVRSLFGMTIERASWVGLGVGEGDGPGDYGVLVLLRQRDADGAHYIRELTEELGVPVRSLVIGTPEPDASGGLAPGDSIHPVTHPQHTGTLGCWVMLETDEPGLLTNRHVVATGPNNPVGTMVAAGSGSFQGSPVAIVTDVTPLTGTGKGSIDAAVARLLDPTHLDPGPLPLTGSGPPPKAGDTVSKLGASTHITRGTVLASGGVVRVRYTFGDVQLRDVIVTKSATGQPFTARGDSGSIVRDDTGTQALALHVAGTRPVPNGIATSLSQAIAPVLSDLRVTLI
jgi:hypothetical protein